MAVKQFPGNTVMPSSVIVSGQSQTTVVAPTVVVPNMQQLSVAPPPLPLPVNVHQPPPGYPNILPHAQPTHVATSSSTESIASVAHTARYECLSSEFLRWFCTMFCVRVLFIHFFFRSISAVHLTAPPLLLPPGVQPPPPGISFSFK